MLEYERFRNPPEGYRPMPFWFWNDRIEEDEITRQMTRMKEQQVEAFFIHARHGLQTPYLSEEWFARIGHVLREAQRLEMGVWLYDENNFPSGYAGGRVLAENPAFCGKNLRMRVVEAGEPLTLPEGSRLEAVFVLDEAGRFVRRDAPSLSQRRWLFTVTDTHWKTAFSEELYIDVLNPAATQVFLRVTHEEYRRRFGSLFGTVIRGFFSDEAGFYNNLQLDPWSDPGDNDTLVWSAGVPAYFREKNGYDLLDQLPFLFIWDPARSPRVRRDFHDTVCSLYRESFLLPQRAYCERYGMAFVGHLHCEDYLHLQIATQGDFTRALAAFSYAGCDRIEYSGEKLTEKLVSSVANQYGQERVLSESFAQGGWGFTYADLRRWTDYQLVRGVNLVVPHAFYYSVRGERKLDCPPSYFLQSPGYPWYHLYAGYAGRLSAVLSGGRPLCHLAVYYPTAAGQVLYDPADREAVRRLDRDVQDIALGLQEALYDYQFINDEALDGLQPQETGFCCGRCVFRALLIPAAPYLPMQAMEAIARLAERGIPVVFLKERPRCMDPAQQVLFEERLAAVLALPNATYVDDYRLYRQYTYRFDPGCLRAAEGFEEAVQPLVRTEGRISGVSCMAREYENGRVYFLVNEQDGERTLRGRFRESGAPVIWEALTGERHACPYRLVRDGVELALVLPPYGSMLVVFGDDVPSAAPEKRLERRVYLDGDWTLRIDGQVLTGELCGWEEPLPTHSGEGVYEYTVELGEEADAGTAVLSLAEVNSLCEAEINGQSAGVLLWRPYRLETGLFHAGTNHIRLKAVNTLANAYEGRPLPSGIHGPAVLDLLREESK